LVFASKYTSRGNLLCEILRGVRTGHRSSMDLSFAEMRFQPQRADTAYLFHELSQQVSTMGQNSF
jgi:hypothetical protein